MIVEVTATQYSGDNGSGGYNVDVAHRAPIIIAGVRSG